MPNNQSISPIGNFGLGSSGAYSSYDPSMMMSMMSGYGVMNPILGTFGGMGGGVPYMNPMMGGGANYYTQYMEAMKSIYKQQEEIEKQRLQSATEMHAMKEMAEYYNLSAHDQAFFSKAMLDGYIQQGIREMYDGIRKGNMDYVVQKFYELKQGILNKYSDHFASAEGGINSKENINNYIRILYSEIAGAYTPGAPKPDLINDIQAYGETPFWHGFNKTWLGNKGHNQLNAEEALNQMFGTGINDAGSKAKAEQIGGYVSRAGEVAAAGVAGSVAGATALGVTKLFTPSFITKAIPDAITTNGLVKWSTKFGTWAKAGALALAVGDILWQMARD